MARFERCGYGTCRSPELSFKACQNTPACFCALALLLFFSLTLHSSAQDVNVHIQPNRRPLRPKPADSKEAAVKAAEANLKNHSKPGFRWT